MNYIKYNYNYKKKELSNFLRRRRRISSNAYINSSGEDFEF